jgi:hypothetical protein
MIAKPYYTFSEGFGVVSQKYFIKIGTTKEDRTGKVVIPRLDRGIQ